ncbi:MAG: FCD domain-containing protein, partial [Planctomycetaceae bacterium]
LAQATGNSVYPLVLAPIQNRLTESRLQTLKSFGAQIAHMHHQRILDAVRARDESEAAAAMAEHLQVNQRHLEHLGETRGELETLDREPAPPRPLRRSRLAR